MAAPLLQSLIASSAACLEHCSAFSYTPHPFAALAAILRNLETALPLAAEIALYSVFLAADLELMADAPVKSLRRLLLAPEIDEYRTRFLDAVVVMDKKKVAEFEDIPQHCYSRLKALVGDPGCGAEVEGSLGVCEDGAAVAVAASGQDIHDDRDCETTAVAVTALAPEDKVREDKDHEIVADIVTAVAVAVSGGDVYAGAACDVASEDETPEEMARQTTMPAPAATLNGDIHEDETTAVAPKEHTYEDMASEIPAPENHNHENTICEDMAAVPAATPEDNIHEDNICEITAMASEDHAHNGTVSKFPIPENHIHEACEITVAVVPAAEMDMGMIPDVTTPSKDYTHKYTVSEITVPAESKACEKTTSKNYTDEITACKIPPATT